MIENKKLESRFAADASGKKKKVTKKEAPTKNYTHWDEKTFRRLIEQSEESLSSQFTVSHGMIMTLLLGCAPDCNKGYRRLIQLITRCHESENSKRKLRRRGALLFKSLVKAGVVFLEKGFSKGSLQIRMNKALDDDFSLNHALSLYLLHALELLDASDPEYALNVLSLVESITENPRTILQKQVDRLRTLKLAELKAEGMEYDQRIEELDKIEHPKPLREFIYSSFNAFSEHHPWVEEENIQPKSIAREMIEEIASFNEYVKEYGLERSEGVLLRHLSTVYKIIVQTIPEAFKTQEVWEIQIGIRTMLGRVDSSLVEEWEQLFKPKDGEDTKNVVASPLFVYQPQTNPKPFIARVRADVFALVSALGRDNFDDAAAILRQDENDLWDSARLESALAPFYEQHSKLITDARARAAHYTQIEQTGDHTWRVRQTLLDVEELNDWYLEGEIRIDSSLAIDSPIIHLVSIGNA
jgi:hypothetical protein